MDEGRRGGGEEGVKDGDFSFGGVVLEIGFPGVARGGNDESPSSWIKIGFPFIPSVVVDRLA